MSFESASAMASWDSFDAPTKTKNNEKNIIACTNKTNIINCQKHKERDQKTLVPSLYLEVKLEYHTLRHKPKTIDVLLMKLLSSNLAP